MRLIIVNRAVLLIVSILVVLGSEGLQGPGTHAYQDHLAWALQPGNEVEEAEKKHAPQKRHALTVKEEEEEEEEEVHPCALIEKLFYNCQRDMNLLRGGKVFESGIPELRVFLYVNNDWARLAKAAKDNKVAFKPMFAMRPDDHYRLIKFYFESNKFNKPRAVIACKFDNPECEELFDQISRLPRAMPCLEEDGYYLAIDPTKRMVQFGKNGVFKVGRGEEHHTTIFASDAMTLAHSLMATKEVKVHDWQLKRASYDRKLSVVSLVDAADRKSVIKLDLFRKTDDASVPKPQGAISKGLAFVSKLWSKKEIHSKSVIPKTPNPLHALVESMVVLLNLYPEEHVQLKFKPVAPSAAKLRSSAASKRKRRIKERGVLEWR